MRTLSKTLGHKEELRDPWMPRSLVPPPGVRMGRAVVSRGGFTSVQVNVDEFGNNIPGDAANEPSIAVDPTSPNRMVIGWRQFDTTASNFRQAGWGYTTDAGLAWTAPGVLDPQVFRSDPVVKADADGNIYYYSLTIPGGGYACDMFKSGDGGVTWTEPIPAFGGDKAWMSIDRTGGMGHGHIYAAWDYAGCCGSDVFIRSVDGGLTYSTPIPTPGFPIWGTSSVGPDGAYYLVGRRNSSSSVFALARSLTVQDASLAPAFDLAVDISLGGSLRYTVPGPNPGGLLGQVWVATDHSEGATHGNVYVLSSVDPPGSDPLDVMFVRSPDGGQTWSDPIRVNDDLTTTNAWQWFGTMSVAPNGRIDVIWNDTRNGIADNFSELFYTNSFDGGSTWSASTPVSPMFDSHLGWPNQSKLGDYYDMVSDNAGVNVAYAATFNGEQDVYFLRIGTIDCNENGIPDAEDVASGASDDCNGNSFPDECEPDCNDTNVADPCDIADGTSEDCDGNFVPDECDPDFDGDGTNDGCDSDIDNDGVLNEADVCDLTPTGVPVAPDGSPRADTNANCGIDLVDYSRFRTCLTVGGPDVPADVVYCAHPFDFDEDGDVDMEDLSAFFAAFGPPDGG